MSSTNHVTGYNLNYHNRPFKRPVRLTFSEWRQIFEVNFFLLSAHFNRLLYIEGNEFKD